MTSRSCALDSGRDHSRPLLWTDLNEDERRLWLMKALIADCLNIRSREFVEDVLARGDFGFGRMTEKQISWLNEILRVAFRHGVRR
jgi:hypothetical protein